MRLNRSERRVLQVAATFNDSAVDPNSVNAYQAAHNLVALGLLEEVDASPGTFRVTARGEIEAARLGLLPACMLEG